MDIGETIIFLYIILQCLITLTVIMVASFAVFRAVTNSLDSTSLICTSIIKAWMMGIFQMRSIYVSCAIHSFDFITDLFVIHSFLNEENGSKNTEHVDTKGMAYVSILIVVFHRIISSISIWKDYGAGYGLLQALDLALFVEVYHKHTQIVRDMTDKNAKWLVPGMPISSCKII